MPKDEFHPFSTIFPTLIFPEEIAGLAETIVPEDVLYHATTITNLPKLDVCENENRPAEFRIVGELGKGGMGVVHLADQHQLGRKVAIKTTLSNNESSRHALLLEGRIMGMVEHPNVIPVHSLGEDHLGRPWIVMKRIVGDPWDQVIQEKESPESDSDALDRDLKILIQVCQALGFAHQMGIIHRDIKPANVFVGEYGEVYLVDWGLALAVDDRYPTIPTIMEANAIAGTPAYIAPEMTIGDGSKLGFFTDIYLVGAVLYQILSGKPPHLSPNLMAALVSSYEGKARKYPEDLPTELKDICEEAMALNPQDRFKSIKDLQSALEFFLLHRSSMKLTQDAISHFAEVEALLKIEGEESRLSALVNETTFSLRSAINIWKENERAIKALDQILTMMIGYELDRDNPILAKKLFTELCNGEAALKVRIDAAVLQHNQKAVKFEALEKLEHDVNANVGARRRVVPTLLIGVAFLSVLPLPFLAHTFSISFSLLFFVHFFALALFIIPGVYYFRKTFQLNFTNRVFIKGFAFLYLLTAILRTIMYFNEVAVPLGYSAELLLFASANSQLMLAVDRRVGLAALFYTIGAVLVFVFEPLIVFALFGFFASLFTAIAMQYTTTESFGFINFFQRRKKEKTP